MGIEMSQEEVAAVLRKDADMAQRVCGFITACNSLMEQEAESILAEVTTSEDVDDLKRFIFGLAGFTAGCLTSLSFLMGIPAEALVGRFSLMNEMSFDESMEQAEKIITFWEDQPDE